MPMWRLTCWTPLMCAPFAALLRVLDNPAQDVELSSVLLSPLYPYTPDDLVQLRAAVRGGNLYAAVLHGSDPRFAPFLQDMEVYRELARALTVGQLIEELFARTGYLAAVGAMPDGARCRDDLLAFAAWAANAGARGLSALVRAMDAAKAGSGVQAPSIGQSRPGCVSIMTVHRSKGLEFPVVFVANTSHKFNQSDAIYPVLYHKELGIGLMLRAGSSASRYKTLPYTAVAQTIKRETLSEEMRILYVALTRAQDALIITVPLKRPESELKNPAMFASAEATDAEAMLGAQNWALWLLTAAMLHPASEELWKYSELLPHHIPTEAPLNIRLLDPPPAVQAAEPEAPALPDDALTERLLEAFTWQSPNKALETIPVKVSVSAVTHTKQELTLRRPAFLQKSGMTGAERGTAIHAFFAERPLWPAAARAGSRSAAPAGPAPAGPGAGQSAGSGTGTPVFLPAGYGSALPLPARSCGKNRSLPRCRPEKSSPKRRAGGESGQGPGAGAGHCRCGAGV